jgi:hypothetical protein
LIAEENDISFNRSSGNGHSYIEHTAVDAGALFIQAGTSANNKLAANEH